MKPPFLLGFYVFSGSEYPGYFAVMAFGRAYVFWCNGRWTFRTWDNIWRKEWSA